MTFNFQRTWLFIRAVAIVFMSPLAVWAHHCSTKSDCWNTGAAETAASLGIAAATALAAAFRGVTGVPQAPKVSRPKSRDEHVDNPCIW